MVLRLLAQLSSVYHTVTLEKLQVCSSTVHLFIIREVVIIDLFWPFRDAGFVRYRFHDFALLSPHFVQRFWEFVHTSDFCAIFVSVASVRMLP